MTKRTNYIVGWAMIVIGLVLIAATYKYVLIAPLLIGEYALLIGGGLLLIYVTRDLHKAADNVHQAEQSIGQKEQLPQIIITIAADAVNIQANNMDFNDMITTLEISKLQLINQSIRSQKTIEIVKKP